MATLPVQRTWAVSEVVTAAMLNDDVRDAVNFLLNPPTARAYNSANLTIANNTSTALTLDSERWDTDAIHSTSTNTSRLTCKTAGLYDIWAGVAWAANATGARTVQIVHNGANVLANDVQPAPAAGELHVSVPAQWKMAVNDYVEIIVKQTSGGNLDLDVLAGGVWTPEFGMTWVGVG